MNNLKNIPGTICPNCGNTRLISTTVFGAVKKMQWDNWENMLKKDIPNRKEKNIRLGEAVKWGIKCIQN